MEQMTVTAKIQISATADAKVLLDETMSVYSDACNYVSDYVFRTHDLSNFRLTRFCILHSEKSLDSNLRWLSPYLRLSLKI